MQNCADDEVMTAQRSEMIDLVAEMGMIAEANYQRKCADTVSPT